MFNSLTVPPYQSIKHLEGAGNWAVKKYYKLPYKFFYRHKLKMITNLMGDKVYQNILDYGSGQGIFVPELKKRGVTVKTLDFKEIIDPRWKFDAIVCASVLEFCQLTNLRVIRDLLKPNGKLFIASPMETCLTRFYFNLIKDTNNRNSHKTILDEVNKLFKIERYDEWLNLYFALRASKV